MSDSADLGRAGDPAPPPPKRGRPAASEDDRTNRRAVIEQAALACLAIKPFDALSVDEIAAEAGVSRRTFYRFYDSKRTLFGHILQQRAIAIAQDVRYFMEGCTDFTTCIVEGTMETLRLIAEDAVFRTLMEADNRLMLDIMDVEIDRMPNSLFETTWRDVFARGRASGELRASLTDREVAEWLRGIHFLLALRPDLNDGEKRALLTDFVVPSLTLRDYRP